MTYKEARSKIQFYADNSWGGLNESIELAIKALEKQIPKKPIDNRYPWVICPNCSGSVYLENIKEHIHNEEASYCEHCGQALDWSDTE